MSNSDREKYEKQQQWHFYCTKQHSSDDMSDYMHDFSL